MHSADSSPLRASFSFNASATLDIYPLSLHDALPIYFFGDVGVAVVQRADRLVDGVLHRRRQLQQIAASVEEDRKSTRLNSSHRTISYAVFCLKKKTQHGRRRHPSRPEGTSPRLP